MALLAALAALALAASAAGDTACYTYAPHSHGTVEPTGETCAMCISVHCTRTIGWQAPKFGCGRYLWMPEACWQAADRMSAVPDNWLHCECAWCFNECAEEREWRLAERDYTTAATTAGGTSSGAAVTTAATSTGSATGTAGAPTSDTSAPPGAVGTSAPHGATTANGTGSTFDTTGGRSSTGSAPTKATATGHSTRAATTTKSDGGGGHSDTALTVALLIAASVAVGLGAGMAVALWYRHYAMKRAESDYAPTPLEAYVSKRS